MGACYVVVGGGDAVVFWTGVGGSGIQDHGRGVPVGERDGREWGDDGVCDGTGL